MRAMTTITCDSPTCDVSFDRRVYEVKRNAKLNRGNFCSRGCAVTKGNKSPDRDHTKANKNLQAGNLRDDLTPFRWFYFRCRQRKNKIGFDLTPEYLKELWDSQGGICPLSGFELTLPADSRTGFSDNTDRIRRGSVDVRDLRRTRRVHPKERSDVPSTSIPPSLFVA